MPQLVTLLLPPVIALVLSYTGSLWQWSQWAYDWQLSIWSEPQRDDIVIIEIDDISIEALGRWPWPRSVHAELLDNLTNAGAKVIGFDIIFAEADTSAPQGDIALAQAIENNGRVVLPMIIEQRHPGGPLIEILPLSQLVDAAASLGHVDLELDEDGTVRSVFLKAGLGAPHWPALPLAMLRVAQPGQWTKLPGERSPNLGAATLYTWQRDYQVRIPFHKPTADTLSSISYSDVLKKNFDADFFRDRFVLVGPSASGIANKLITPNSPTRHGISGTQLNGQVLASLLNNSTIETISRPWRLLLSTLLAALPLLLYPLCRPRWTPILTMLLIVISLALSTLLLRYAQLWFPIASTLFALALSYPLWIWQQLAYAQRYMNRELHRLEREMGLPAATHHELSDNLIFLSRLMPFSGASLHNEKNQLVVHWGDTPDPPSSEPQEHTWTAGTESLWQIFRDGKRGGWALGLQWIETTPPNRLQLALLQAFVERAWSEHGSGTSFGTTSPVIHRRLQQVERLTFNLENMQRFVSETLTHIAGGVIITDSLGEAMFANTKACEYLGHDTKSNLRGLSFNQLFADVAITDYSTTLEKAVSSALLSQQTSQLSASCHDLDLWLHISPYNPHTDLPSGLVISIANVTSVRQVEQQTAARMIMQEKTRALVTLNSIGEAVISTNAQGIIEYINPAAEQLLGCTGAEVYGLSIDSGLHVIEERSGQTVNWPLLECQQTGQNICLPGDNVLLDQEGQRHEIRISLSPIYDNNQQPIGFVLAFSNISELREMARAMEFQANHDELTELPNRTLLTDRLKQAIIKARRSRKMIAIFFIDLDRFKKINDGLGHETGDLLIKEAANRLLSLTREEDTIARLGGDEFVMIIAGLHKEDEALCLSEKIVQAFASPINLNGYEVTIGVSVGVSIYPRDGRDQEALLRNADRAMYQAKAEGGNGVKFYAETMNLRAIEHLMMERNLRQALDQGELQVHYQPQVNIGNGKVIGLEALLRWQHSEHGAISPDVFVPLAEETGLIIPIGEWLMKTVCKDIKCWLLDTGLDLDKRMDFRVSINLSPRQFAHGAAAETLAQILHDGDINGCHLGIEITEGMFMHDIQGVSSTLDKLKAMNVKLVIDDFGTGYSSLSYLKRFPIDQLKIDKSFVREITSSDDDAAIATAVIAMAHSMGRRVIAEGVETAQQLAFLQSKGCDEMQGFYFSPAVPASRIPSILTSTMSHPV